MKVFCTLLLLLIPFFGYTQIINIPDANFKAYLVGNNLINTNGDNEIQEGEANTYDSYISAVGLNISDLTGIEAFISITHLHIYNNQITNIDLSQNTLLEGLTCDNNQLTALDLSQNLLLSSLSCTNNQLVDLDLSNNFNLTFFQCGNSELQCLNIANGNNLNLTDCYISDCPLLYCIEVDDSTYMSNNLEQHFNPLNSQYFFSNNCINNCSSSISSVKEKKMKNRKIIKIIDLKGQEIKPQTNQPVIEIYDDSSTQKKLIIE